MRRLLALLLLLAACTPGPAPPPVRTRVQVGWCQPSLSPAFAPLAVAERKGWLAEAGLEVEVQLVADCVGALARRSVEFIYAPTEAVVQARLGGVPARLFYTVEQGSAWALAVPAASPVQAIPDLKGRRLGVPALDSPAAVLGRALAATAGLDPEQEVRLVAGTEADALLFPAVELARLQAAGMKLRYLDMGDVALHPGGGLAALEDELRKRRKVAARLAEAYARGAAFAALDPEEAMRLLRQVRPEVTDSAAVLRASIEQWGSEGGHPVERYQAFLDFLLKWGVIKEPLQARDLIFDV